MSATFVDLEISGKTERPTEKGQDMSDRLIPGQAEWLT